MKNNSFLKRFFLIFSALCVLSVPLSAIFPSLSDMEIYDNVIRLHVLANSDSEIDQEIKLAVRDGVLKKTRELLDGVSDRAEAEKIIAENLSEFEAAAEKILRENGFIYSAEVTLSKEKYPTRNYGGFSLPSGEYTSLRIMLGDAEGQNWWCVLFPSLCNPLGKASGVSDSELTEAGLTPSQVKIITGNSPEVKIKFRFIELISAWFK